MTRKSITFAVLAAGFFSSNACTTVAASPPASLHTICEIASSPDHFRGKQIRISSDFETNDEYAWLEDSTCPEVLIPMSISNETTNNEALKAFKHYVYDPKKLTKTKKVHIDFTGSMIDYGAAQLKSSTKVPGGVSTFYFAVKTVLQFKAISTT
ncbi:MAG: hypothetical protein QM647_11695 [Asticcacaulis sp.]|uniref:hypothetical protein n=1 Tax=Asticcacaulis sp. TaxID=1872648 RepID=UPI0039E324DD